MNISGRVLGTAPRIRFCRGTQTVFMMTREGIVKKGHWENISFVISKILLGKHPCYKLFMSIDGTLSDDSCIPVLVSYMGDDDQYQIRFLQSFYEFICHYMEYGSQYIKRNPLSYSHQNDGFWSRPRLGIVLLPPFPYPEAYQLKESDIHIGLRFLSYYLWFQFLPISVNNEVKNFKEFPKEMERL